MNKEVFIKINFQSVHKKQDYIIGNIPLSKNEKLYDQHGHSRIFYFNKEELDKDTKSFHRPLFFQWILNGRFESEYSPEDFNGIAQFFSDDSPNHNQIFYPLIIQHVWEGNNKRPPQFRIDQKFDSLFNLYFEDKVEDKGEQNLKWIDPGSENEKHGVVKIDKKTEEGLIKFSRLQEFCDIYKLGLIEYISITRKLKSKDNLSEFYKNIMTARCDREIIIDDTTQFLLVDHLGYHSPGDGRTEIFGFRRIPLDELKKEKKFVSFLISEKEEKSCEPNPGDDSGYYQPVAFKKEVLNKYYNDNKYKVDDSLVSARIQEIRDLKHEEGFYLRGLDTSHEKLVLCPLYNLSDLPVKEQEYWKSHNSSDLYRDNTVQFSPGYLKASREGIPPKTEDVEQDLPLMKRVFLKFKDIQEMRPKIFSDERLPLLLSKMMTINITDDKKLLEFASTLDKIFFHSIEKEVLMNILKSKDEEDSIKKDVKVRQLMTKAFGLSSEEEDFLKSVNDLRNYKEHPYTQKNWGDAINNIEKYNKKIFYDPDSQNNLNKNNLNYEEIENFLLTKLDAILSLIKKTMDSLSMKKHNILC